MRPMSGAIAPIRPVRPTRRDAAPKSRDESPAAVNVTINVGPVADPPLSPRLPPTNLEAHLIAQTARTRGLRSGQKVLETARHAYLETEWSGPNDRRAHAGQITRTKV
jgi:hypothetical protein